MFHFIERSINIARFKLDSAAAVDDYVRAQSQVARIERASVLGRRLVFADPTA